MVTINKQGLVSLGFGHCSLPDIYTFVHDTSDHHFDNQLPIHMDCPTVFTKQYTYNKLVTTLQHEIQETDTGFLWKITRKVLVDELHTCRFGITVPLGKYTIEDKNGPIQTALINFQQQWQNKYLEQTNIDLPILRLNRIEPILVCTPITDGVQFFKFKENNIEYLKIATQTGEDLNLTVYFIDDEEDLKQAYCKVFPQNKDYIYRADILKRKIQSKYHIRVLSHEIFHRDGYTIYPPDLEELESYMGILEENLDFYPVEAFDHAELKTISVCGYLSSNSELIKGFTEQGGILLNASANLGYNTKCKAIHHEIFHMIERSLSSEEQTNIEDAWVKMPTTDSFVEHFKEIRSITHPAEYRSELFATFVLDPRFVNQLSNQDATVRRKLDIVKSIFGSMGPRCNQISQNHDQSIENNLIWIYEDKCDKVSPETLDRLLVGIKHSCLPDLLSVMNKAPDSLMVDDPSQIPIKTNIAYVTISPLDFCAIEYIEQQVPVEDSFAQWIAIHTALESNNSVLRLKSEDVLTFNMRVVKDFLEGAGASFEVYNLWDITKEVRPYHLDSVPFLKNVWSLFRNTPVVTRVGYGNISYEE